MGQVKFGEKDMNILKRVLHSLWAWPLVLGSVLFISPVQAQQDTVLDDNDEAIEEITVTGSRIKRDEFSSPSPIQVLDVESGRQLGISSISELLQRATVANGSQIDASLNTNAGNSNASEGPPTGGVGSSSIDLRGLGPERTLVLLNGRRLGSTGARGAPAQPDINMIPFSMVERVEVLTEGVSAVYGADAVAGVVNVILRDEFDGVEIMGNVEQPSDDGGEISQISFIAGVTSDRGSITFGAEVFDRTRVTVGDRSFSRSFRDIQITDSGEIIAVDYDPFFDNVFVNLDYIDDFDAGDGRGNVFMFWTPGTTDVGIPNISSYENLPAAGCNVPAGNHDFSVLGDGQRGSSNFPYCDFYNDQDERRASDLVGPNRRTSAVTTGKIALDLWSNEEFFFEAYYLNTQLLAIGATEQIFPDVPGRIPQEVMADTDGDGVGDTLTINVDANGVPILVDNPLNPFSVGGTFGPFFGDMAPILTMDDFPQTRDVEKVQYRILAGLRGDLGDSSWSYEGFFSYDRGIGFVSQPILFENNLILATQDVRLDPNGVPICGPRNTTLGLGSFDTPNDCVPIDWTNPDIYTGGPAGEGKFTQAEHDFLIGNRTNRTVVEQTMFSVFATGDLFEFGDRTIAAAVGFEFRDDEITSQNSLVGVQGANAAENPLQEGETIGDRDVTEFFGEVNVPLLDTLTVDAAFRFTDESNFGSETTYRARISWAPLDYVTLSGSAGTSFRAPNLREQFLAGQGGGIGGTADPCLDRNIQNLELGAARDNIISNCIASGIAFTDEDGDGQPDTNVLGTLGVTTIPTSSGGNIALVPETSDSFTATIQFTQPWADAFDFDIAVSYWSIEIVDSVNEPRAEEIIGRCFRSSDGNLGSAFCDLLTRPGAGANPASNIINFVDVSFINIGEETAKGIDINTRLLTTFDGLGLDLSWATATTYQLENEVEIFDASDRDDNVGEIGVPEWKFTSTLSVRRGDWEILMQNRFIDDVQYDDTEDFDAWTLFDNVIAREVDFADSKWYTDLSLSYLQDTWAVTLGVNNLFDEEPPLIDAFGFATVENRGANQRNNAVTSTGYDLFGTTWFLTAAVSF